MAPRPWMKDAFFCDTKTGDNFPVQSIIFPTESFKTIKEFVHRCRLLKTENDCYCTLKLTDEALLVWDSTFLKEKIMLSNNEGAIEVEFRLSSDETNLEVVSV